MAYCHPLGGQHEGHQNGIDGNNSDDRLYVDRRTATGERFARRNTGPGPAGQKRNQGSGIRMCRRTAREREINDVNLLIAVSSGRPASSAASCQGSTSDRASADRTLSNIPFLSAPTDANRKSSNSMPSRGTEADCAIFPTEFTPLPLSKEPSRSRGSRRVVSTALEHKSRCLTRQTRKLPSGRAHLRTAREFAVFGGFQPI